MEHPTVHINGTSRQQLLVQQMDAIEKLQDAKAAIQTAAPHSRDYYVKTDGANAYSRAVAEHSLRLRAIDHIINELTEIGTSL